ncbi:MAG: alpha-hydroxy-acid oxidizing protein [Candidatus Muiribacteriota bacterium]
MKINIFKNKCFNCALCNGKKCGGIIPGMGGAGKGLTFINNFISWEKLTAEGVINRIINPEIIGVAPMTGVDENMGGSISEREFHQKIIKGAMKAGFFSCIGDGTPEYKLLYGCEALKENKVKGNIIIKPFENSVIFEKIEKVRNQACAIGIDIDSVNLITMDGKAVMNKKNADDLIKIKNYSKCPFIIKGVFSEYDFELVKQVKPEIAIISNHGGRVFDNGEGTGDILKKYSKSVKNYVKEIWVDGGIRKKEHILKALEYGADRILIGRPFAVNTILHGIDGVKKFSDENNLCF